MTQLLRLLTIIFLLRPFTSNAQISFKKELRAANPVKATDTISNKEKIKVHEQYLKNAVSTKNYKEAFYGHLFLYVDFYKEHNYETSNKNLMQADSIASHYANALWEGAIYMRKAALSDIVSQDYRKEIEEYQMAVKYCNEAKDSLCMAESLEQIGSTYAFLEKYDSAHYYYKQAIPLLQQFADREQMALTYNNYSNLLAFEKNYREAKQNLDSAIAIANGRKDTYKEMMYTNNLGSLYTDMGQYDKAIEIYRKCIVINKQHNWTDRLMNNYNGLMEAFEKKKDYAGAFENLKIFYLLKDSITGEEVKLKIGALNALYEPQSKEIELEKQNIQLVSTQHSLERRNWGIAFGLLIIVFVLLLWWFQKTKAKKQQLQSKNDLVELTRILIEKNTLLADLEEKLSTNEIKMIDDNRLFTEASPPVSKAEKEEISIKEQAIKDDPENQDIPNDFENNFYNQRILTPGDWFSFKSYFEKAYPNYLFKLRSAYPAITEAEERLFLFIKLNLTNKEAAAILGISPDSVKKTRTRLRKKLNLEEKIDLDEFVKTFNQ